MAYKTKGAGLIQLIFSLHKETLNSVLVFTSQWIGNELFQTRCICKRDKKINRQKSRQDENVSTDFSFPIILTQILNFLRKDKIQ